MKTLVTIMAFAICAVAFPQNIEPTFEKEGETVKATYFHENGQIAQTGFFMDGKLHGEWKMYNEEGKKIVMGQYALGKKTGKWFFWEKDGLKEVDYADNKVANVTKWNNSEAVVLNK